VRVRWAVSCGIDRATTVAATPCKRYTEYDRSPMKRMGGVEKSQAIGPRGISEVMKSATSTA
jgi:hypothetical protein